MSGTFTLIASYPKSGNTWARIVFERLLRGADLPINEMDGHLHGTARRLLFDTFAPVNAADLSYDEFERFLPEVYRHFAAGISDKLMIKVHECARTKLDLDWIYPPSCVSAVAYIVRHPFDVAVSVAHHFGFSHEEAVELMADDTRMRLAISWAPEALPVAYGSWSRNVSSWLDAEPYRVTLARYEDIHLDPVGQFLRLALAAELPVTRGEVARVVEASGFDQLRRDEVEHGFRERPSVSPLFFRSGQPRSWEGVLGADLQERLVREHGAVMERLGYAADGDVLSLPGA